MSEEERSKLSKEFLMNLMLGEKIKDEWKVCPEDCLQKRSCQRIRETHSLASLIMERPAEINPIFKDMHLSIVGSVREGSRVFFTYH